MSQINILSTIYSHVYEDEELLNGWTIIPGGTRVYLEKVGKSVKFQAMIKNTSQPSSVQILVIPEKYRPTRTVYLTCHNQTGGGGIVGGIYILPSGLCYFSGAVPSAYSSNLEFNGNWFTNSLGV